MARLKLEEQIDGAERYWIARLAKGKIMKTLLTTALLSLTLVAAPVLASSSSAALDDAKRVEITEKLKSEGYDVRKIDVEDGQIEVYALKDGKKVELYLAPDLSVSRIKTAD